MLKWTKSRSGSITYPDAKMEETIVAAVEGQKTSKTQKYQLANQNAAKKKDTSSLLPVQSADCLQFHLRETGRNKKIERDPR
ncbi:hypothetical protein pdam_00017569 [Pocillopora damicornis]|uniref:Uncharacterized protein n=1 Tax=Pocillopora damicornis TaxID=46731 RepID=A0A3M6TRC1_POCDA|nr:hypothetical protein pdam_00017569 [Pocillopora damicornis]